jgi:ATP-dependent DNA helicase RecG
MNPSAELVKDFPLNTARIIPVYHQSKTIKTNQIRKLIAACVPTLRTLPETLPKWMLSEYRLVSRAEAVEAMHYPDTAEQLAAARRRLGFEEVLELRPGQLAQQARKYAAKIALSISI